MSSITRFDALILFAQATQRLDTELRKYHCFCMGKTHNLFDTLKEFDLGNGKKGSYYSLPALEKAGIGSISKLPVSIRIVLESILRNYDGKKVAESSVRELAHWEPKAVRTQEIPFIVARIVLQDFTGVPLLVDLAAMRTAAVKLGKNPKIIEPLVPVDLVVDHSVQVDFAGAGDSMARNLDMEFQRNRERYQFLKWGMQAFDTVRSCRPASELSIRSTSNISQRVFCRRVRFIIPTRLSAPIRTRQ